METKKDYRKDTFESLESARQWFDRMEHDVKNDHSTHYGDFFVTSVDDIRIDIETMIDDYKAVEKTLDRVLARVYQVRQMLEADCFYGLREAKTYWQDIINIEVCLTVAKFNYCFDKTYNPAYAE